MGGWEMAIYVRRMSKEEEWQLVEWLRGSDKDLRHRAEVVVLGNMGYRIPEIAEKTKHHPANLRKWIHRFNRQGVDGLKTCYTGGRRPRITPVMRQAIVELAKTNRGSTLHELARQAIAQGIVDKISHEKVRQILNQAGVNWRRS